MQIYTVQQGDTWFSISEKFDLSIDYLKQLNSALTDQLVIGQQIIIAYPKIIHYAIQGDTLESIAQYYNTTVVQLLRNNPYLTGATLQIGDRVIIEFDVEKKGNILLNGYCYTFIDKQLFLRTLPYLTFVTVFTYGFTESGILIYPERDEEFFIKSALNYGTAPLMHLSTLTANGVFSNELAGILLNNRVIWQILIDNIVENVRKKGYKGVDIDFEYLPAENSSDYADFVGKLKAELNKNGYYLITALAPKTSSQQKGLLYEGHNYSLLGENSDLTLLMTYEWGYAYSEPMAVAPIASVERVIEYGVSQIPSDKILMGLPFYGYDWKLPYIKGETVGLSLSVERAMYLARTYNGIITFDEQSASPYMEYSRDGVKHIVWFENPESIQLKMELIGKYNLAGAGIWNIDRPFYQGYTVINLLYEISKVI